MLRCYVEGRSHARAEAPANDIPYDAGIGTPVFLRRMLEADAFVVITVDRVATHSTPDGGETEFRVRTDVHGEPLLDGERANLRAAIGVLEHALTNLRMRLAEDGEG